MCAGMEGGGKGGLLGGNRRIGKLTLTWLLEEEVLLYLELRCLLPRCL
jgi:hypothetical protein